MPNPMVENGHILYLVDDGLGSRWTIHAKGIRQALMVMTPQGMRLEEDPIQNDHPLYPTLRDWRFFFVVSPATSQITDYFGIRLKTPDDP